MMNHCHKPVHCHKPANVCHKPTTTQVMPAVVHPTQHNIVEKTCEYIVPEVHPTHTTNVTNHVYKHVHSFPNTVSNEQSISNQQFMSNGPVAGAMSQPPRPPMMGGQMMNPGFAPQAQMPMWGNQGGYGHGHGHGGCGCKR